jgi:glycerophosphoryl diester phosphodiesterase
MIRPLLLGHRGARREKSVGENTLASFDLALAQGCDGFEFDVRLSADGKAVISHDAITAAHRLKISKFPARRLELPLLSDVLTRYRGNAFLDIELKVSGLEKITTDLLRRLVPARGWVVSSFLPEVLQTLHGIDAGVPLGLICETKAQLGLWPELPVDYVIPNSRLLRRSLITEIKDAGRKVLVWTVNVSTDMKRFAKWGVDGIISDRPRRLVETLGEQEKT